jgi:biotin--protein ligase
MIPEQLLIYRDKGVDPFCLKALVCSLQQELLHHKYTIAFADRHLLKTDSWKKNTKLLIFPGGRDIPYQEALQGHGNRQIVDFVQQGGSFLGICAGAYYGSAFIEFEKGTNLEVIASRELCFFPGKAQGPVYGLGTFDYYKQKGARIASLKLDSETLASYYHGGCAFLGEENNPNVSIIAQYDDLNEKPPAIVHCSVGLGRAVLCGVHPEYSAYHERTSKHLCSPLFSALQEIETKRRILFVRILKELSIKTEI